MQTGQITLKRKTRNYIAGFCVLNINEETLIQQFDLLHPNEKAYYNSLRFEKRRLSFLAGRVAAKKAIQTLCPALPSATIWLEFGVFTFPVVKGIPAANIQVSISHCDKYCIVLAFPEAHPMGVDIEKIDPKQVDILQGQSTRKEQDLLQTNGLSAMDGLSMLWTVKESLSKVLRTGLMTAFILFEISKLRKENTFWISDFKSFAQYKAVASKSGDYFYAVVLPRKTMVDWSAFHQAVGEIINKDFTVN